jgi:hypothetical protein
VFVSGPLDRSAYAKENMPVNLRWLLIGIEESVARNSESLAARPCSIDGYTVCPMLAPMSHDLAKENPDRFMNVGSRLLLHRRSYLSCALLEDVG